MFKEPRSCIYNHGHNVLRLFTEQLQATASIFYVGTTCSVILFSLYENYL